MRRVVLLCIDLIEHRLHARPNTISVLTMASFLSWLAPGPTAEEHWLILHLQVPLLYIPDLSHEIREMVLNVTLVWAALHQELELLDARASLLLKGLPAL